MNAASTDYLLFSVSLPTSAGNTFQRLSAPLSITFSGRSATPPLSDPS